MSFWSLLPLLGSFILVCGLLPNAALGDDSGNYVFVPTPNGLKTGQNNSFLGFTQSSGGSLKTAFGVVDNEDCYFEAGLGYDDSYPAGRDQTARAHVKFGAKGNGSWRPTVYVGTLFNSVRATYADQNLIYGSVGWEFENWGIFSFGAYVGNGGRLKDENGLQSNRGFLFGIEKELARLNETVRLALVGEGISGQNEVGMYTAGVKYKKFEQYFLLVSYSWKQVRAFGSDFAQVGVGWRM